MLVDRAVEHKTAVFIYEFYRNIPVVYEVSFTITLEINLLRYVIYTSQELFSHLRRRADSVDGLMEIPVYLEYKVYREVHVLVTAIGNPGLPGLVTNSILWRASRVERVVGMSGCVGLCDISIVPAARVRRVRCYPECNVRVDCDGFVSIRVIDLHY